MNGHGLNLRRSGRRARQYNNEGERPSPRQRLNVGYPDGAGAFFALMDRWRASGTFDGLDFTGG